MQQSSPIWQWEGFFFVPTTGLGMHKKLFFFSAGAKKQPFRESSVPKNNKKKQKQFNKHNRHVLRTAVALPEVMKVSCNMLNVPTTWRYLKKTFHVKVCHAYMYNLNIVIGASLSKLIWCFFYSVLLNHKEKPCKAPIIWAWCRRVMSRDYIIGHPSIQTSALVLFHINTHSSVVWCWYRYYQWWKQNPTVELINCVPRLSSILNW